MAGFPMDDMSLTAWEKCKALVAQARAEERAACEELLYALRNIGFYDPDAYQAKVAWEALAEYERRRQEDGEPPMRAKEAARVARVIAEVRLRLGTATPYGKGWRDACDDIETALKEERE